MRNKHLPFYFSVESLFCNNWPSLIYKPYVSDFCVKINTSQCIAFLLRADNIQEIE